MDREFCPEKHNFTLVKERIIKTSQMIEMYKNKEATLAKATKAFKNLKALCETKTKNLARLEHDNNLISYRNNILTQKIDEFNTNYNKILKELENLKPEYEKLLEKYNDKLIEFQNLDARYNQLLKQCICHQEFDENQFKYKGMKIYRELKQDYNRLKRKIEFCNCQLLELPEHKEESSEDEEVPQILKEAKIIEEIDLVTRFTESPVIEDSHPSIIITPPTPNAETKDNFLLQTPIEALKQRQIERRRKYWIPNNFTNFPSRKSSSVKTRKCLSKILSQLVKAKITNIITKRRRKRRLGEFTSETEPELERLFDRKGILGRNRRLVALAKIQNPNSSDSDMLDSGLVSASPKNSTDNDTWLNSDKILAQDQSSSLEELQQRKESLDLEVCKGQSNSLEVESKILEDPSLEKSLDFDLGVCKDRTNTLEELQREKTLHLGVCKGQINTVGELQREETLHLGVCKGQINTVEELQPLDLEVSENQTNTLEELLNLGVCENQTLEKLKKEKTLHLGVCKGQINTVEELQREETLHLDVCKGQINTVEELQPLDLEVSENQTNTLEELLNLGVCEDQTLEKLKKEKTLPVGVCEGQINTVEELQREETLHLDVCKGQINTVEELQPPDLEVSENQTNTLEELLNLGVCENQTLEKLKREKTLHLGVCKGQINTVEELQREEILHLGVCKGQINTVEELQPLDLEVSENQTNTLEELLNLGVYEDQTLEKLKKEKTLHLGVCKGQINTVEELQREETLHLGVCKGQINTVEELQPLDLEVSENQTNTLEELLNLGVCEDQTLEKLKREKTLHLGVCKGQINTVEELQREEILHLGVCKGQINTVEELQPLDLEVSENQTNTLEELLNLGVYEDQTLEKLKKEKTLHLGVCKGQINTVEELQREETLHLGVCKGQINTVEELQPLDLEVSENQTNTLEELLNLGVCEDRTCEKLQREETLHLGVGKGQINTVEELQQEEPLDLGVSENQTNTLEKLLNLGVCEDRTLEKLQREETLHLGVCKGQINTVEELQREEPLDLGVSENQTNTLEELLNLGVCEDRTLEKLQREETLHLGVCKGQSNTVEELQREKPLDLGVSENQTNTLEELQREETLHLGVCKGQSNTVEQLQQEELLNLEVCEGQVNTVEELQREVKLKMSNLEHPNVDLEICRAETNNLEELQREEALDLGICNLEELQTKEILELPNLDLAACETLEDLQKEILDEEELPNLDSKTCETQSQILEDLIVEPNLKPCNAHEKLLNSETLDSELSTSPSDSLINILKSLETMKYSPMLSPLPPSPQPIKSRVATTSKAITFDDYVDLEADLYLSDEEPKLPNKGSFGLEEPQKPQRSPHKRKRNRDVLGHILEGMEPLKQPIATLTETDRPMSPDIIELPCKLPKLIPLEKHQKLSNMEARALMDQLIMFSSSEPILNDIIIKLSGQTTGLIAWIILDKLRTDIGKIQKPTNPDCPSLTQLQQILLGFLCKLDKSNHPGIVDKFLDMADKAVRRRHNNNITRLFVALCKMRNDLLRARRFVFNCFYYNRNLAPLSVMFVALRMFPQILPFAADDDPLAKSLVQICFSKLKTCVKFVHFGHLLQDYYNYTIQPIDLVFNEFFHKYIKNPAKKQIEFSLLLLIIHQERDWIFDKIQSRFWPLYDVIPCSNSNLKATLILFIGKVCTRFESEDIIGQVRQWFENLKQVESSTLVKQSLAYVHKKYPKISND